MTDEQPAEPAAEGTVVESAQAASPAIRPSAIVLRADQEEFDHKQLSTLALVSPGLANAPRGHLAMFFHYCVRTGLDPFARQIYMIGRTNWKAADNPDEPEKTWTIQTGIDGFRTVAHRVAAKAGESISYEDTVYYDSEGHAHEVWLSKVCPAAVKVTVLRGSSRFPMTAVWGEFAPTYYDRKSGSYVLAKMWQQMPSHMLRKCAEAGALRMTAPQDLSGVFVDEEMERADAEAVVREAEEATRLLRQAAGLEAGQNSGGDTKGNPADGRATAGPDKSADKPERKKRARPAKKAAPAPAAGAEAEQDAAPPKRKPRKRAEPRRAAS
ncbi:recombinase RecT [Streptomyces sp. NPDC059037]|uniref:recombinase RecT n=1 Tax=Streptomyces sp. NPDC059037 TaxID=3346710 RepID=UPI00367BE99A